MNEDVVTDYKEIASAPDYKDQLRRLSKRMIDRYGFDKVKNAPDTDDDEADDIRDHTYGAIADLILNSGLDIDLDDEYVFDMIESDYYRELDNLSSPPPPPIKNTGWQPDTIDPKWNGKRIRDMMKFESKKLQDSISINNLVREDIFQRYATENDTTIEEAYEFVKGLSFGEYCIVLAEADQVVPPSGQLIGPSSQPQDNGNIQTPTGQKDQQSSQPNQQSTTNQQTPVGQPASVNWTGQRPTFKWNDSRCYEFADRSNDARPSDQS